MEAATLLPRAGLASAKQMTGMISLILECRLKQGNLVAKVDQAAMATLAGATVQAMV